MKIIVGLGNFGKEYENTNHNMGFMVLDKVAEAIGFSFKKNMCQSLVAEGNYKGEKVILAKPTTFMNNSGLAVKSLTQKFGIDPAKDLIIIVDDIDLPPSHIRLRKSGSAGTHNGLRSIVYEMQSTAFARLRVGIGSPEKQDLADYVLSKARLSEGVGEGIDKAVSAVLSFLNGQSFEQIMQTINQ